MYHGREEESRDKYNYVAAQETSERGETIGQGRK
jgi:hypothetical protein